MERILITGPGFCAVTEDGTLTEYLQRDPKQQYGDILGGTVERIMPGIGCAFVDIGRKKSGFLPLEELSQSFEGEKLKSGMRTRTFRRSVISAWEPNRLPSCLTIWGNMFPGWMRDSGRC